MTATLRLGPNILITGTPGTGKTATATMVAEATNLRHINVGDWVKQQDLHSGYDAEFGSYIIDEDKVPPSMHASAERTDAGRCCVGCAVQRCRYCSGSRACAAFIRCLPAACEPASPQRLTAEMLRAGLRRHGGSDGGGK